MYNSLKKLIINKDYDREDVIKKLEVFMAINKINFEQYQEIMDLLDEN